MSPETLFLVACSLLAVPLTWALPEQVRQAGVAAWSAGAVAVVSPLSAVWWVAGSVGTALVVVSPARGALRGAVTVAWATVLVAALLLGRELPTVVLIGAAYFTLRSLHLLLDRWTGTLPATTVRKQLEYQLFLPVLVAGPINRYQHFERELRRRRRDPGQLYAGAERALFGLFSALVVGGFLLTRVDLAAAGQLTSLPAFWADWFRSAVDWVRLYFVFAGFSAVALGISAMMGLRLEENFDRPWRARDLMDFWLRWHRTLSRWCRDYVFAPVSVATRTRVVGLVAAMVVMGLWHDTSTYYLLWAGWQALGIGWTRALRGAVDRSTPVVRAAWTVLGPVSVAVWLTLTHPVITVLLGVES